MFLRRYERRSGGRKRTYWALVESMRTGRGSRQRVVAYLGELAAQRANRLGTTGAQPLGQAAAVAVAVRSAPLRRSVGRRAGVGQSARHSPGTAARLRRRVDGLGVVAAVGLGLALAELAEPGREDVPWPVVAAILTIARFCKPSSELHIETTWYRGTALEDLLGVPVEKVHTDRLYEGLDWLLPHKAQIEKHLKERLGELFDLEYDLLLYDVTSTYFEGQCAGNGLAKRGYSRDSRPDCLQVCIGLVVTTDGIPLGLRGFRRQPPRLDDGGRDRRGDGERSTAGPIASG